MWRMYRVWKGTLGILDLTKIRCENRENDKYLDGIWDLTAPREVGLAKTWAWDAGFFACLLGIHDPNKLSSGQSRMCLLSNQAIKCSWLILKFLIENSESFFSLQMPEMSTCYNSIPVIDSMLNWLSCSMSSVSSRVQIYCNLLVTDESSSSARSSAIHKEKFNVPLSSDKPKDVSIIMKRLKTFTGLAKIAKNKGLREKPEVVVVILLSFIILRCKKLFLFVGTLTEKHA